MPLTWNIAYETWDEESRETGRKGFLEEGCTGTLEDLARDLREYGCAFDDSVAWAYNINPCGLGMRYNIQISGVTSSTLARIKRLYSYANPERLDY